MRNRSPALWLITFRDLAQTKPKKQQLTSPPLLRKWEVLLWLKQQKPMADVISIEPYRVMSVQK